MKFSCSSKVFKQCSTFANEAQAADAHNRVAGVWLEILRLYSHQTQQSEESSQGVEQNPLYDVKLCSSFAFFVGSLDTVCKKYRWKYRAPTGNDWKMFFCFRTRFGVNAPYSYKHYRHKIFHFTRGAEKHPGKMLALTKGQRTQRKLQCCLYWHLQRQKKRSERTALQNNMACDLNIISILSSSVLRKEEGVYRYGMWDS